MERDLYHPDRDSLDTLAYQTVTGLSGLFFRKGRGKNYSVPREVKKAGNRIKLTLAYQTVTGLSGLSFRQGRGKSYEVPREVKKPGNRIRLTKKSSSKYSLHEHWTKYPTWSVTSIIRTVTV